MPESPKIRISDVLASASVTLTADPACRNPWLYVQTVTAGVRAFISSAGALASFTGTWFVGLLEARTGNSRAGLLLMSLSLIRSGLLMLRLEPASPAPALPLLIPVSE